jgi:branched-chain amino acid transport system ATP-binding protein
MILRADGLRKFYGEFCALDGVSLAIGAGEFVSIIGPNGAGKSTLINVLTGVLRPSAGTVRLNDRDIIGIGPVRLARLGMARSFQLVQIFPDLTVMETLQAAVVSRLGRGTRLFASLAGDRAVEDGALEVAELFRLADKRHMPSRQLPQGDKKLLDVASAFALRPEVILLDEPLRALEADQRSRLLRLPGERVTILMASRYPASESGLITHVALLQRGRVMMLTAVAELENAGLPLSAKGVGALAAHRAAAAR